MSLDRHIVLRGAGRCATAVQFVSAGTRRTRISQAEALRAVDYVLGMTVERALGVLRFSPGHTCPPLGRVISAGLADARSRSPEITAAQLVVASGRVGDGDSITRLRRHAHGDAYWLTTHTTSLEIDLALDRGPGLSPHGAAETPANPRRVPTPEPTNKSEALLEAFRGLCIDPDLGVNVVDMGFVREARVGEDDIAVVEMTLCSEVCPLGKVIADQARTAIVGAIASELRLNWVWTPAWSPDDISQAGRERLASIGFSGFGQLEVQSYPGFKAE
ncbi:MAG TPA: uL22 family ribosomal protein [Solirubrobacteraceae bacterium]|jgi:metal-sulfur cluster biosynthetic enzyme/ribosomal protein L22|nr:uL22 family ribosomal protein [Solirubrobacteraceae bacterium]